MDETEQKRRGPLIWLATSRWFRRCAALAVLLLPILYLAGIGPVCWVASRDRTNAGRASFMKPTETAFTGPVYRPGPYVYRPLFKLAARSKGPVGGLLRSYIWLGAASNLAPFFRDDGVWWAWPAQTAPMPPPALPAIPSGDASP